MIDMGTSKCKNAACGIAGAPSYSHADSSWNRASCTSLLCTKGNDDAKMQSIKTNRQIMAFGDQATACSSITGKMGTYDPVNVMTRIARSGSSIFKYLISNASAGGYLAINANISSSAFSWTDTTVHQHLEQTPRVEQALQERIRSTTDEHAMGRRSACERHCE